MSKNKEDDVVNGLRKRYQKKEKLKTNNGKRLSLVVDVFKKSGKEQSSNSFSTLRGSPLNNSEGSSSSRIIKANFHVSLITLRTLNQALDHLCINHPFFLANKFVYSIHAKYRELVFTTIISAKEGTIPPNWWEKFNEYPSGILHAICCIIQPESNHLSYLSPQNHTNETNTLSHSITSNSSLSLASITRNSLVPSKLVEKLLSTRNIWWDIDQTALELNEIFSSSNQSYDYFLHTDEINFLQRFISYLNHFCSIPKKIERKSYSKNFKHLNLIVDFFVHPILSPTNHSKDFKRRKELLRMMIFSAHQFFPTSFDSLPLLQLNNNSELIDNLSNSFFLEQIFGTSYLLQLMEDDIDRIEDINNEGSLTSLSEDFKKIHKILDQLNVDSVEYQLNETYQKLKDNLLALQNALQEIQSPINLSSNDHELLNCDPLFAKFNNKTRKELLTEFIHTMNTLKKTMNQSSFKKSPQKMNSLRKIRSSDKISNNNINNNAKKSNFPPLMLFDLHQLVTFDVSEILEFISTCLDNNLFDSTCTDDITISEIDNEDNDLSE